MPQPRWLPLLVLVVAGPVFGVRAKALAATWSADFSLSDERTTEIAEESTTTEKVEQSYGLSYEHAFHPGLRLSLDFSLDITHEINEPDYDTRDIKPAVDVSLESAWWILSATWETTEKRSADPDEATTRDSSWSVELSLEPESNALPDVSSTFQRDVSQEGGTTQTVDDDIKFSLDYRNGNWLDLTLDLKKTSTDERVTADSDSEDRSYKLDVSVDKDVGDHLRIEAEWTHERQQSMTLADNGDVLERDDSLKNNFRGKLSFLPLDALELTLDREIDWDKDLELGPLQVTDTWTGEISYGADITETIGLDLDYTDERKETRGTDSDSYAITRDYSFALNFSPWEALSFSPSFDRSDKTEWFDDPLQPTEDTLDDQLELEGTASFWDDRFQLTVTRIFRTVTENGKRTTRERNWDVDLDVGYEGLPGLEVSPRFTYSQDEDLLAETTDVEKKWEVNLRLELKLGDVTTFSLDHTYTRTSTYPAEGENTIQRDDDTDVTLSFSDFLRGMSFELGLTRKASDQSKDDKKYTVDYTYNVTYDWEILETYFVSFEYQYDKKSDADDTRNYSFVLSYEIMDGLVVINFEYELDQQLESEKRDTHRYLIEVQGEF